MVHNFQDKWQEWFTHVVLVELGLTTQLTVFDFQLDLILNLSNSIVHWSRSLVNLKFGHLSISCESLIDLSPADQMHQLYRSSFNPTNLSTWVIYSVGLNKPSFNPIPSRPSSTSQSSNDLVDCASTCK